MPSRVAERGERVKNAALAWVQQTFAVSHQSCIAARQIRVVKIPQKGSSKARQASSCHLEQGCAATTATGTEPRGLGLAGSFAFAPTKPAQSCSPGNFILGSGSGTQHPPQSISVKMIPNELYHETPLCWAVLPLHRGKSPNPHSVPTTAIPFCLSGLLLFLLFP